MINDNEVVPEGATHKWILSEADYPWYKKGISGMSFCLYDHGWAETSFSNDELDDSDTFSAIKTMTYTPPSLKDWDDRYPSVHDDVNHPKHYQLGGGLEAIDVIRASLTDEEYRGYLKGNVLKYRLRAGAKGDVQKDIAKADWYKKELDK